MEPEEQLLNHVTDFYLSSSDFNGITLESLAARCGFDHDQLAQHLSPLIQEELIGIVFSDTDVNPHILRVGLEPTELQLAKLSKRELSGCAYPRPKHLELAVDRRILEDRPYALALALGAPQLAFRTFDLSVLEIYRNDPRYRYSNDDVSGHIVISDAYYESGDVPERDRVLLESFGFCYDDSHNRAVAVFLRYLADLSPEHQQIWKAKELQGQFNLHPDYYRNSIIGDWGEGISVFQALLLELHLINQMAAAMGREPLFRQDFAGQGAPSGFSFLIRPTSKEYYDFVLLLDKLLSENINQGFFQSEVPFESREKTDSGEVLLKPKGSISILEDWLRARFRTGDWQPIDRTLETLKEIRRKRQTPAHKIEDNVFDNQHYHMQRDLIIRAYDAVHVIRLAFANHPSCNDIKVPAALDGAIWTE
jgi:hypothetical protein